MHNVDITLQLSDGSMDGTVELNVQLSYKNWRSSKQKGKPFGFNQSDVIGRVGEALGVDKLVNNFLT